MRENCLGALDLGSGKVTALIAEIDPSGMLDIFGVGITDSRGVRQGVIVDLDEATSSIVHAVHIAEEMAGVKMPPVCASITGEHISSINSDGGLTLHGDIPGCSRCVEHEDVRLVLNNAQSVQLGLDKTLLHVVPKSYSIDGNEAINPIGQTGFKLGAKTNLVVAGITSRSNLLRCIESANLKLDRFIFSPLASAYTVLREQDLEHGVALIDMGSGTCDVAFFADRKLQHTFVYRYSGERVTRDVAMVLKSSLKDAENLKVSAGLADPHLCGDQDQALRVPDINGNFSRTVYQSVLARIIGARTQEIFNHILREADRMQITKNLGAGVVLTGGMAALPGITNLAKKTFNTHARIGLTDRFIGPRGILSKTDQTTAIGLLLQSSADDEMLAVDHFPAVNCFEVLDQAEQAKRSGFSKVLDQIKSWR
jgi:cell division protein FtsA